MLTGRGKRLDNKANEIGGNNAISLKNLVARARIELATRGFSVRCSTN